MLALLAYAVICLIWGSTWIAIKIGLDDAPPLTTLALRFILAGLILNAICLIKKIPYPKSKSELLHLAIPGLFTYTLNYIIVYYSEVYIESALTAILYASMPFYAAVMSIWLLPGEKQLNVKGWFAMGMAMVGIVIISGEAYSISGDLLLGTLLALGASLSATFGTILLKRAHAKSNLFMALTIQLTVGTIPMIIGALLFDNWSDFAVTDKSIGSIIYLAIFGTVIAFSVYYWLIPRLNAIFLLMSTFIIPIIATLIGVIGFGEQITLSMYSGAALVLSSVLVVVFWGTRPPNKAK
jgi:drug/metabolite transporter (DMT)-like permease